jgi:hypothetical protein
MTSDAGLTSPDTDYTRHIQEVLNELRQMEQTPRLVISPDELETLEREIRHRTDRLGSLLTDGVSRIQTNESHSTCWPYCHGHTLPPSW